MWSARGVVDIELVGCESLLQLEEWTVCPVTEGQQLRSFEGKSSSSRPSTLKVGGEVTFTFESIESIYTQVPWPFFQGFFGPLTAFLEEQVASAFGGFDSGPKPFTSKM